MSEMHDFALLPRDGLFCKDGRGWFTSESGRGHALDWPWPSTIHGALATATGKRVENEKERLSPKQWLAHAANIQLEQVVPLRRPLANAWQQKHRVWPVPVDALWIEREREVHRLNPTPQRARTLGRAARQSGDSNAIDLPREALWWPIVGDSRKPLPAPRWWDDDSFCKWITGKSVSATSLDWCKRPTRRLQTHVGIMPGTMAAEDGVLFSHDVVEMLEADGEWAVGVRFKTSPSAFSGTSSLQAVRLGSDGRIAHVERLPGPNAASLFEAPAELINEFAAGAAALRLVVTSPTLFANGWLPDWIELVGDSLIGLLPGTNVQVVLRAAFVPRPMTISGWSMATPPSTPEAPAGPAGPKESQRFVQPGAVYFFERVGGDPLDSKAVANLWLAKDGARTQHGFGRVVPGVWQMKRSDQV